MDHRADRRGDRRLQPVAAWARQNRRTAAVNRSGCLEVADVAAAGDHHELAVRDRALELACDAQRRPRVELTPDQQGRRADPGQQVALVGLGHHGELRPEGLGADRRGDLLEQREELGGWVAGEQPGQGGVEPAGRRVEHPARERDPRPHLVLRQRPLPAGVGVGEHQRRDQLGTVAVELQRERAAPGESGDVRRAERERLDQRREAACVVREAEPGRARRPSRPAPGSSQATTVNSSRRAASCGCHMRPSPAAPWTNTSGGPSPARRYATSSPFAMTASTIATYTRVGRPGYAR